MAREKPILRTWPALLMLIIIFFSVKGFGVAFRMVAGSSPTPMIYYLVLICQELLFYLVPAAIYMSQARGMQKQNIVKIKKWGLSLFAFVIVMAFVHQIAMQSLTGLFSSWLSFSGASYRTSVLPMPTNSLENILAIFAIAIVPAVCEECLFRGAIFPSVRREFGDGASIAITSIIFALMHGNLQALPSHLFAGFVLTLLCFRSKSLTMPIVYHFAYNAAANLCDVIPFMKRLLNYIGSTLALTASVTALLLLISFVLLYLLPIKGRGFKKRTPSLSAVLAVAAVLMCFIPYYLFDLFPV